MHLKESSKFDTDLQYSSIDNFSEWLDGNLAILGIDNRVKIKLRLLLEEILLRVRDNFGEEATFQAHFESKLSGTYIQLEMAGEAFNPLSETNAELGDWNSSLQTAVGLNPKYSYVWGKNILKVNIPAKKINPVLKIFIFLLVGLLLGVVGHLLLTKGQQAAVSDQFLTPAYELWIRTLNAISGPIVFFTVITTMLNTKRIDKQGGNSANVVARYFGFSFLIAASSIVIALPMFILKYNDINAKEGIFKQILQTITAFVPNNIIEPFLDSNTPQLLFMAFVLGAALIVLGTAVTEVKRILRQINMVGLKLAEWTSLLVPLFAGLFLCLEIIKGQTDILQGLYKPLIISLLASILMMLIAVLYVCLRLNVSPHTLSTKIQKPFFIALKTGSLDTSFEHTKYSCSHLLGIDEGYTKISLPQGLVLYMPVSAIGTLIFTMYSVQVYNVKPDWLWYVSAIIFAVLLFVATPPVPGANLLAYVVFFNWLGIPREALMDAMIFDIIFGIFAGAGNQMLLQIELVLQARKIGILNEAALKKPLEKTEK